MRRRLIRGAALTAVTLAVPGFLAAQATPAVPAAVPAPAVGDTAPDFVLSGATAAGATGPIRLSEFRGKTVVLAFFFKARTKG
jgi:hypothetical protein